MAQLVPQPVTPTAAPNHYPNPLPFSAVPNQSSGPVAKTVARKRQRKRVRVESLYLEREPEPKLHARALLELIQDECPDKVGSFIPRSHLDRAYRELCDHKGWEAFSWVAIARALGTLTCKKLLKRNGARFMAYRLPAPSPPTKSKLRSAARDCPRIAPGSTTTHAQDHEKPVNTGAQGWSAPSEQNQELAKKWESKSFQGFP